MRYFKFIIFSILYDQSIFVENIIYDHKNYGNTKKCVSYNNVHWFTLGDLKI